MRVSKQNLLTAPARPGIWIGRQKNSAKIFATDRFSAWYCYVEGGIMGMKNTFSTNILVNLGNNRKYSHGYNERRGGTRMRSVKW